MSDQELIQALADALFDARRHGYFSKDLCWCGECSVAWNRRSKNCIAKAELFDRITERKPA